MSQPANLEQMLDRMARAEADSEQISVRDIVRQLGYRSFSPLMLFAGLITVLPIGGIPGVPTVMGFFVLLVSVQLLVGRKSFWLPGWLLQRSVSIDKFEASRRRMIRPARFIDRFLRPRLTFLTGDSGHFVVAIVTVLIALMMPPMELIPFSALGAGLALTLFGLALLANDGVVVLMGLAITLSTFWVVLRNLL